MLRIALCTYIIMRFSWMIKSTLKLLFGTILCFLLLPFLPISLDMEPVAYNLSLPEQSGPYAPNNALDSVEMLFVNQLHGPESLAVHKGSIYTGTEMGHIYRITGDKLEMIVNVGKPCGGMYEEEKCGRPLGMRFDKAGNLYTIDAYNGIFQIDLQTGTSKNLCPGGTKFGGKALLFGDDLDIDDQGVIYISEASNKWPLNKIINIVFEHENTGRILAYHTKTRKTEVLATKLHLPNGVQLTADQKALLISELGMQRILKLHLQGPKKGQMEVFADELPGQPDNIRPSPRGTYWVAYVAYKKYPSLEDMVTNHPLIRKATARALWLGGQVLRYVQRFWDFAPLNDWIAELENSWILYKTIPPIGIVTEHDKNGKVIRSLQSRDKPHYLYSEAKEIDGYLYLGSYRNKYLGRLKL